MNLDAATCEIRRGARRAQRSEPRERSEPAQRRARERVGESEGRSPSGKTRIFFSIMRKLMPVALIALAISFVPSAPLRAWGFAAHKLIADRAIDLLPPEIRPFFQKNRTTIVEHAIDPDTYRIVGWTDEDPRHFLDMDNYGPSPFKDLPHDYAAAVAARGEDFVKKSGVVPWRTQEMFDKLREAFTQLPTTPFARDNVKLFSSLIAHYVADSF